VQSSTTPVASSGQSFRNDDLPPLGTLFPAGQLHDYGRDIQRFHLLLDAVMVPLFLGFLSIFRDGDFDFRCRVLAIISGFLVAKLALVSGLYSKFRARSLPNMFRRVFLLWGLIVGSICFGFYGLRVGHMFSRELISTWFLTSGAWLLFSHVVSRQLFGYLKVHCHAMRVDGYIGTSQGFDELASKIKSSRWLGNSIKPLFFWTNDGKEGLANLDGLTAVLEANHPDQWLVEDPGNSRELDRILARLEDQTRPVLVIPRWLQRGYYEPILCHFGPVAALQLSGAEVSPIERVVKHGADRLVSAVLVVLLSPILLAIALAVRVESPGPSLFRQTRYGLGGVPFTCFKFRTMWIQENGQAMVQAKRGDSRITKLGSFLRASNLDELPQLMNVLRGEMSLVGPRPHSVPDNERYRVRLQTYMRRHAMRPGMTGWAQVLGLRGATETDEKMASRVQADVDYIRNWSFRLDLKILLMTLLRGRDSNAY
jgi:Undecaprenyl-phosphate glucose phosphotransferase